MGAHVFVSPHRWRVYEVVKAQSGWVTTRQVALAAGVHERTARAHLRALTDANMLDEIRAYDGHRYRVRDGGNPALMRQIEQARDVYTQR